MELSPCHHPTIISYREGATVCGVCGTDMLKMVSAIRLHVHVPHAGEKYGGGVDTYLLLENLPEREGDPADPCEWEDHDLVEHCRCCRCRECSDSARMEAAREERW